MLFYIKGIKMKLLSNQKILRSIYLQLTLLYLFNVFDILFTLLFMKTNAFTEWNPFILWAIQSPPFVLILKCILTALLLLYLSVRIKRATLKQLKISKILILIITCFYGAINLLHLGSFFVYQSYSLL